MTDVLPTAAREKDLVHCTLSTLLKEVRSGAAKFLSSELVLRNSEISQGG